MLDNAGERSTTLDNARYAKNAKRWQFESHARAPQVTYCKLNSLEFKICQQTNVLKD